MSTNINVFNLRLYCFFLVLLTVSCSTVRHLKPIQPGQNKIDFSLGGPLFTNLGFAIPAIQGSIHYLRGITSLYSTGGTFNLATPFFGWIFIDSTHVFLINHQKKWLPSNLLQGHLHFMTDFKNAALFFPEVSLTLSWNVYKEHAFYLGSSVWANAYRRRTANLKSDEIFIPTIYLGARFSIELWEIYVETKWIHPRI